MNKQKCLIITNGFEQHLNYIKNYILDYQPYIICVDGGIELALKNNIIPNILIGDLDSILSFNIKKIIQKFNINLIKLKCNKKFSDLKYAIDIAIKLNYNHIVIINATYGRIDHFLCNIYLLEYTYKRNIICKIININNKIIYWDGRPIQFKKIIYYKYFSIIPISNNIQGLTINGFKYNINNAVINRYNIETISNEYKKNKNFLYYKKGKALIIFSRDNL